MLQWATGRLYLNLWCRVTAKVCVDIWLADWLAYWWWICGRIFMWHFVQWTCWSCISTINVTSVGFDCIEFCSDNIQLGQSELGLSRGNFATKSGWRDTAKKEEANGVYPHCCRLDWGVWAAWRNNAEALEKQLENFKTKVLLVSSCFRSMHCSSSYWCFMFRPH